MENRFILFAILCATLVAASCSPLFGAEKSIVPTQTSPAVMEPVPGRNIETEGKEITSILASFVGRFTEVYKLSRGNETSMCTPFIGNGNFRIALDGDQVDQRLHFENSELWGASCAIQFGGMWIKAKEPVERIDAEFFREHNIPNATMTGRSAAGFETACWVASRENILVTKVTNTRQKPLEMEFTPYAGPDVPKMAIKGKSWLGDDGKTMLASRQTSSPQSKRDAFYFDELLKPWTSRVVTATRILDAPATIQVNKSGAPMARVSLAPGQTVTVITVMKGGRNATAAQQEAEQAITGITQEKIISLKKETSDWWKNYWLQSYVSTGDPSLDKLYYGALYLNACVNRSPFTPAGQYPFCRNDVPAWFGDLHMNQEYFGQNCWIYSANRVGIFDSCLQPILDLETIGRATAANCDFLNETITMLPKGSPPHRRGIMISTESGPWGMRTGSYAGCQVSLASFTGATLLYWRYAYTQDLEWLKNVGYPFLVGVGDFWESHLTKKDGRWHGQGSTHESKTPTTDTSTDIALAKFVMRALLQCSKDLGVDANRRHLWRDILDNIADYPLVPYGKKEVWAQCAEHGEKSVHICRACAVPIYPGEDIHFSSPTRLLEAARNFISLGNQNTYEFPVFGIAGARVGYSAEDMIVKFKRGLIDRPVDTWRGMRPNFTVGANHYNGAFIEFINTSMLQNEDGDAMRIFANWPKKLNSRFVRLRAKGAFLVSAEQKVGMIGNVEVLSEKGRDCTVLNPWPGKQVQLEGREVVSGERFTFKTRPGEVVKLTPVMGHSREL